MREREREKDQRQLLILLLIIIINEKEIIMSQLSIVSFPIVHLLFII